MTGIGAGAGGGGAAAAGSLRFFRSRRSCLTTVRQAGLAGSIGMSAPASGGGDAAGGGAMASGMEGCLISSLNDKPSEIWCLSLGRLFTQDIE